MSAFLELGYDVNLFAPGGVPDAGEYGTRVKGADIQYGYRCLAKNVFRPLWRDYALFSGTTEDPQGISGVLSRVHRKPLVVLADEIYSGLYRGNRSERWKRLCRWGMRRPALTIVNDQSRVELQRDYAGLRADADVIVYPGCFRNPPEAGSREQLRGEWGVPRDSIVIAYSGMFNDEQGIQWLIEALKSMPELFAVIQPVGASNVTRFLLKNLSVGNRIYIQDERLSWTQAWQSMGGIDIGVVAYTYPAPQFQNMGTSSNRLCMFLAMGVPVVASRQESFEFLERYDCGVLADDTDDFVNGVREVSKRLDQMRDNALRCSREYVAASQKYEKLKSALSRVVR